MSVSRSDSDFAAGIGYTFSFGMMPLDPTPVPSVEEAFADARIELESAVKQGQRAGVIRQGSD